MKTRKKYGRADEMKTRKKWYAADNDYGTATSYGFGNTWSVLVFDSRTKRDAWVARQESLAARAITKKEVPQYAANWSMTQNREIRPRPFSGEAWVIVPPLDPEADYIGEVDIDYPEFRTDIIDTLYHR